MFYTYILLLSNLTYYTGITNNLNRRLVEHNKGESKSTRKHLPVTLVHTETFETRLLSRKKEVYIKNKGARRYLNMLKFTSYAV